MGLRVKGDMVDTAYNIIDCHYDEVKNTLEFGRKDRLIIIKVVMIQIIKHDRRSRQMWNWLY